MRILWKTVNEGFTSNIFTSILPLLRIFQCLRKVQHFCPFLTVTGNQIFSWWTKYTSKLLSVERNKMFSYVRTYHPCSVLVLRTVARI